MQHRFLNVLRSALTVVTALVMIAVGVISISNRAEAQVVASYDGLINKSNPEVYYRLGESAGLTAIDSSGNGRNGTFSSNVAYSVGGAITGDANTAVTRGTAPVLTASNAGLPTGNQARSFETWFKMSGSSGIADVVRWGTSTAFTVALRDLGQIRISNGSSSVTLTPSIPRVDDGKWHHLAVTYDGSTVRGYIDGALAGSATFALSTSADSGLSLGSGFPATYDEAAVYSSVLSGQEINERWTKGASNRFECAPTPASSYASLVKASQPSAYYRLGDLNEDPSSRVAFDYSGNCRNGAYFHSSVTSSGAIADDANAATTRVSPLVMNAPASGLPTGSQARSFETWFKMSGPSLSADLVRWGTSTAFRVALRDLGQIRVHNGSSSVILTPSIPRVDDGKWHHLAVTYDGSTVRGYIDGALAGFANLSLSTSNDSGLVLAPMSPGGDALVG